MNCMASSARVFQFTHPGGVRRLNRKHSTERASSFNSRTREGCDQINVDKSTTDLQFQFTHPGGVRLRGNILPALLRVCFNSRTREGCDYSAQLSAYRARVSIHAPGRGATRQGTNIPADKVFQFTHPGGVRLVGRTTLCAKKWVSIHAPGRGATARRAALRACIPCFNSRTREGCDYRFNPFRLLAYQFQFTHPGGVRLRFLSSSGL